MAENVKENRFYKRVLTPRMTMVVTSQQCHAGYIEDISAGGAMIRLANDRPSYSDLFEPDEELGIYIDELTPLIGKIVRITEPMIAIAFVDHTEEDSERLAAEIMAQQDRFHLEERYELDG